MDDHDDQRDAGDARDVKVRLDKAMGTSLIMLYGLAYDASSDPSVLHDMVAARAYERVEYDFASLKLPARGTALGVTSRAKWFDDRTREFLAGHANAVVVNLAAGLDSRVWRIEPGPGVDWYDLDYPDVIDVRRRIFPERKQGYQLIGSSATDPGWLARIETGRPTLVIAQGLTMYLDPDDGHALFARVTERFAAAGGEVLLDTHNAYALRRQNKLVRERFGATLHWSIEGPDDLVRRNPGLRCTAAVSGLALLGETPGVPWAYRLMVAIGGRIPKVRDAGLYLRFAFGPTG